MNEAMMASEISAELVCKDRIVRPKMPSQKGEILRKNGFVPIKKGRTKRTGYTLNRLLHNMLNHQYLTQSDELEAQT